MKLLIISNGHGEDLVGAELVKKLSAGFEISALPLVGAGRAYEGLCPILGPRKIFPGGGFSLRNLSSLFSDIKSGYLKTIWEFYQILKSQKPDLVVGIGDIIPIIGAKLVRAPFVFIGVNKTDYYKWFGYSYTPWEIRLLGSAKKVFARDQLTANNLSKKDVKAEFVGNPLMDTLTHPDFIGVPPLPQGEGKRVRVIGLLPGTREADIELNIKDFIKISREINKLDRSIDFVMALPEPRILRLGIPSIFPVKPFEQVLAESILVIGLSGTGNEQAAGLGIPVISFPGAGSQFTQKFGEAQKQLLDQALVFVPNRNFLKIARKTIELLKDGAERERMKRFGIERMGGRGSIEKIARFISQL